MGVDFPSGMWHHEGVMTATVRKIADQVKALPKKELDEFLSWLVAFELEHAKEWDREVEKDSMPGGRLSSMLERVRGDIAEGRTKPLDEVIDNS